MKLKRLEILGFKSFKDKTPLDLSCNINAIVGPNGCGKSNIVDAIRWVMGEQRITTLRGKKMEDVIFNGSDDAPAVGMAEVSITLESNGNSVPEKYADYGEITVSRRIFREGEGEYYINKAPCRLLDVKEFFMDAGVGARTYSIVEQEKIANLVEAKPEDRRQFIEEAAGIMKYKTRRDSASRKMDATRQNILRLNDILREVRSQLNSTSRQAKKADRYKTLKKNIKEYQLALSLQTYSELVSKMKDLEQSRVPLNKKTLQAQTELKTLEAAVENIKTQLIESEDEIGSLQDNYYGIKNEINIREHKIGFANETISQLNNKKKKDLSEVESLRERKRTTTEETVLLRRQTDESNETIETVKDSIAGEQETTDALKAAERKLKEDLEREKSRHIDDITENARLNNLLSSLTKSLEDLEKREERERREIGENNKKRDILRDKLATVQSSLAADMERIELLKDKKMVAGDSLNTARTDLRTVDTDISEIREETGAKVSRLTSLRDLQERHEWCDEGTRNILEAGRANALKKDIRGLVADYIDVPKSYETAVEAALEGKLQYIIVENQNDGIQAIDYLKKHSSGRGSFVPLDNGKKPAPSPFDLPEGVLRLRDLVCSTDERCGAVVRRLMEDILLVPDLETARCMWQNNGFTGTYVTPEGDMIRPDGALAGGNRNSGGSSLSDRREITELESQIEGLQYDLKNKKEMAAELHIIASRLEKEETQLQSDIHGLELELNSHRKDTERLEGEIKWIEQHNNVIAFNRETLESEKMLIMEKAASVESEITSLKNKTKDGERLILAIQEEWERARVAVEEKEKSLTEKKMLLISMEEKKRSGAETVSRLERAISEIDARMESVCIDLNSCDIKTGEAVKSIETEKENLNILYSRHQEAEEALAEKREDHGRKNVVLKQNEQTIQKARKAADDLSKQVNRLEMEIREAAIQAETLKESVSEKFDADLDILLPEFQVIDKSDEEALKKKLQAHKKMLEEFGEVNLLALSEHEELKERHDFLSAQIKDLNASLETLQKTITRINQISRKRFAETFEAVNHHFKKVFPRLFPGVKETST